MDQFMSVFDYLKKAFYVNREHRQLYIPQITLVILKTFLIVIGGSLIYQAVMAAAKPGFSYQMLWHSFLTTTALWIVSFLIYTLFVIIVEAGLYEMFKACITNDSIPKGTFIQGVRKHTFQFFLIDWLIIFAWGLFIIPYILIGIMTLATGFVLVPFIVHVFTAMWKVSLVMDNQGILASFKKNLQFSKTYFGPLAFLVLLKEAFSSFPKGSGFNSNISNFNNSGPSGNAPVNMPSSAEAAQGTLYEAFLNSIPYLKIGFWVLIPVVSIAVFIASLIKMIFQIFFMLALFIMYHEHGSIAKLDTAKEVL